MSWVWWNPIAVGCLEASSDEHFYRGFNLGNLRRAHLELCVCTSKLTPSFEAKTAASTSGKGLCHSESPRLSMRSWLLEGWWGFEFIQVSAKISISKVEFGAAMRKFGIQESRDIFSLDKKLLSCHCLCSHGQWMSDSRESTTECSSWNCQAREYRFALFKTKHSGSNL